MKEKSYKERIKQLKEEGIEETSLKSCWCVDCKNVKKLPNCPKKCDGIQRHGIIIGPVGYKKVEGICVRC